MNKPLIRQIIKAVEAEPRRINMTDFITLSDREAPCGTAACIAGYAVLLNTMKEQQLGWKDAARVNYDFGMDSTKIDVGKEAIELLGITSGQADALFYVDSWPPPFKTNFEWAGDRVEAAGVVVARLKHFMKTGK